MSPHHSGPTSLSHAMTLPGEVEALEELIRREAIHIVFQPIVDLRTGVITGHEALTRLAPDSGFEDTGRLFEAAARCGRLQDVEALARRRTFETLAERSITGLLFINNSPTVMAAEGFVEEITERVAALPHVRPDQVVLELTEQADVDDLRHLCEQIGRLREKGFQMALDDVGSGVSGLNRIMALRPDWVKLDRELVSDIDQQMLQQNLLRSILQFARLSNMSLVAEGIERHEELEVLVNSGVAFGQGYFLARPGPFDQTLGPAIQQAILSLQQHRDACRFEDPSTIRASTLAITVPTCDRSLSRAEAMALLDRDGAQCLVVLDGRRYGGLIEREQLEWSHAPHLRELPARQCPLIGVDVTLAEALHLAGTCPHEQMRYPLVIQDRGAIVGVVPARELLRAAAECQQRVPSHLAALTGLPSRVQADRWVAAGIRARRPHDFALIDLRDFDAYNVTYGFQLGDAMLRRLVGLIQATIVDDDPHSFFAHLGEDRFVVAFRGDRRNELRRLVNEFAARMGEFFSTADMERGSFGRLTPHGDRQTVPITTVRVIYLDQPLMHISTARDLHDLARELRLADHEERRDQDALTVDRRSFALARSRSA